MSNRALDAAWSYHEATKHSFRSVRSGGQGLDWENQPFPFKVYPALEPIPLPREPLPLDLPALEAVALSQTVPAAPRVPVVQELATLLYFAAGVTRRRTHPGGTIYFRAAACTGALYQIELYVVCGELPGLPAGVYHFNPGDMALRRLREGDHRGVLVAASGADGEVAVKVCQGVDNQGVENCDSVMFNFTVPPPPPPDGTPFRRGDATDAGSVNITSAIFILNFLFGGGGLVPACADASDIDNNGKVNITDPVNLLNHLFGSGAPPAAPGLQECGLDPDEPGSPGDLGCDKYESC